MATKSAFSIVGLAHKICLAAEEQGYTPELLNALAEDKRELFKQLLEIQLDYARLEPKKHVVDLNAAPMCPRDEQVVEHQGGSSFEWDESQVEFFQFDFSDPALEGFFDGQHFYKQLAGKPVLNVNVASFLIDHPRLIPKSWEGHTIFFWGTTYETISVSSPYGAASFKAKGIPKSILGLERNIVGKWQLISYPLHYEWKHHYRVALRKNVE